MKAIKTLDFYLANNSGVNYSKKKTTKPSEDPLAEGIEEEDMFDDD